MLEYEVKPIEREHIEKLKTTWIPTAEANEDLPEATFERAVAWAEDVLQGNANTTAQVHGVFCTNGDIHALFDLVPVRPHVPKGYFKILSMVVAPHLDLNGASKEQIFSMREALSEVVGEVIGHGLNLLHEYHEATKVKFFASDRITLSIMQRAWGDMDEGVLASTGFETNLYGNWAEFSKTV
ncbi:hypothetical protein OM427_20535 [Halomonas sp. 18H]|nr:hypothetical protein [Halomonas sp. 18H]MCW4151909.1 hypothetical protein [Halomonas sp. 18H]